MDNLYDELLRRIKNCVKEISFQQLKDRRRLLVIAINEERIMKNFLQNLLEFNHDIEIVFIAQPGMASILRGSLIQNASVLEWQGKYTAETADYVKRAMGDVRLDSFLYFCDQPVNLRNRNIMDIAEALDNGENFWILSMDSEGTLFKYQNIELYNRGIHLYEEADAFINLCLKSESEEEFKGENRDTGTIKTI